ncbi:MAG: LacI family transcriptional regulator [Chloroflexi bacterium HGW-Chloroflexi-4]|jgi:LacI family transcriptional regulator|nr:MAG: LacI family transcriptional regulator [Chloroflexi bacterium HGW-Chloroflexi-4]
MNKNQHRPTMTDVAKLAGVSQTTVSFVLNNVSSGNISEETKTRVLKAVKALGYRNSSPVYDLRNSRTHMIGFVTDEIGTSPFAGDTLRGAQEMAWASNKMLVLLNTGGNKEVEEEAIQTLLEREVEGIIYAAMFTRQVTPPASLRNIPTVLMNCFSIDKEFSSVIPSEVSGGRKATEALIKAGHNRIGLINGEPWMHATEARSEGYKKALETHGIEVDTSLICYGNWRPDSGYDNTMSLMSLPNPPTAIFCGNDLMAVGAYQALAVLGKQIPNEVAVVGYDNQEQLAVYLKPPLSTVALPHYEIGRWAVKHLLELIESEKKLPAVQEKISCPFISRESI